MMMITNTSWLIGIILDNSNTNYIFTNISKTYNLMVFTQVEALFN